MASPNSSVIGSSPRFPKKDSWLRASNAASETLFCVKFEVVFYPTLHLLLFFSWSVIVSPISDFRGTLLVDIGSVVFLMPAYMSPVFPQPK